MYTIRKATLSDLETIIEIAGKTWWATYSPILEKEQIEFMLSRIYSVENISAQLEHGGFAVCCVFPPSNP